MPDGFSIPASPGSAPPAGPRPPGPTPFWNPRVRTFMRIAVPAMFLLFFVVVFGAYQGVLLPLVLGLFVAYLLAPPVRWLSAGVGKVRLPRGAALALVYIALLAGIGTFGTLVMPRLLRELAVLPAAATTYLLELQGQLKGRWIPLLNEKLKLYMPESGAGAGGTAGAAGPTATATVTATASPRAAPASAPAPATAPASMPATAPATAPASAPARPFGPLETAPAVLFAVPESAPAATGIVDVVPRPGGGYRVVLGDVAVRVDDIGDGRFVVSPLTPEQTAAPAGPDFVTGALEKALVDLPAQLGKLAGQGWILAQSIVSGTIGLLVGLIVMFMVSAFVLLDIERILGFIESLLPTRFHADYRVVVERLDRGLSGVIRGQLLICLINGIFSGVGFWLLGLKFWLVLAIMAGVGSLVPIFGTVVSSIPAVGIGLTQGFGTGALVLAWILGVHFVEANFLNPNIIGTSAKIHPVLVILSLIVGEAAAGLAGALLAVPTFSILQTVFLYLRNKAALDPAQFPSGPVTFPPGVLQAAAAASPPPPPPSKSSA